MAEYIDRIDFINKLEVINGCVDCNEKCRDCGVNDIKGMLRSIPAADVAPVVHGHWVDPFGQDPYCSVCGFSYEHEQGESAQTTDYCGNCGAKMDEEG